LYSFDSIFVPLIVAFKFISDIFNFFRFGNSTTLDRLDSDFLKLNWNQHTRSNIHFQKSLTPDANLN
jgi:hypothetical protein